MAKGNPLLGQLRGSIGDIVFSRLDGQQVSRSRNRQPNNPQTDSQMTRRVLLKTASMAYSALRENLGNQTFQRNAVGAPNQRAFISKNIRLLSDAVENGLDTDYNFASRDQAQPPLNPYIISAGSLADPGAIISVAAANNTQIKLTRATGLTENSTYKEVAEALGLPEGSQLTIVIVRGQRGNMEEILLNRIVLAPVSGDTSVAFLNNNMPNLANPSNITDRLRGITIDEDGALLLNLAEVNIPAGIGVVASQRQGNTWYYSNTQLVLNQPSGFQSLSDAVESWTAAAALAPAREYTRQAESVSSLEQVETPQVTAVLARVYQYNDIEGWANSNRQLIASNEINGNSDVLAVDSGWDSDPVNGFDSVAVELEFYGVLPRTFNETNMRYGGDIVMDNSSIIQGPTYNAGKKSYNVLYKFGQQNYREVNQTISLLDNNGNQIAEVAIQFANIPRGVLRFVSVSGDSPFNVVYRGDSGLSSSVPVLEAVIDNTTVSAHYVTGSEMRIEVSSTSRPAQGLYNLGLFDVELLWSNSTPRAEIVGETSLLIRIPD